MYNFKKFTSPTHAKLFQFSIQCDFIVARVGTVLVYALIWTWIVALIWIVYLNDVGKADRKSVAQAKL